MDSHKECGRRALRIIDPGDAAARVAVDRFEEAHLDFATLAATAHALMTRQAAWPLACKAPHGSARVLIPSTHILSFCS